MGKSFFPCLLFSDFAVIFFCCILSCSNVGIIFITFLLYFNCLYIIFTMFLLCSGGFGGRCVVGKKKFVLVVSYNLLVSVDLLPG